MLRKDEKISSKAYIDIETKIGKDVRIGPFTQVLSGSVIEDNCVVGSYCIIGQPSKLQLQKTDFSATSPKIKDFMIKDPVTKISEKAIIRSGSTIYKHVIIGRKLRTGHNVLIREHVTVGDNCVVGTRAILDGYIKIGNNSMIQSQCYIAQSVRIGKGVFIAPGCLFFDNKKIILGQGLEGATIEDYVRIGGGTKILPGVKVAKYALVGAGSVVTKDLPSKAIASGVPAQIKGFQTDAELKIYVDSVMKWK